jgi:hypothetical protein
MDGPEYVREGVDPAEEIFSERTGVTHLVHAWHQQGHPVRVFSYGIASTEIASILE